MTSALVTASTLLAGVAVWLGVLTVAATRSLRTGLAVALDLLLAAGLLRLAVVTTWQSIAGASAVVLIRRLAMARLSFRTTATAGSGAP